MDTLILTKVATCAAGSQVAQDIIYHFDKRKIWDLIFFLWIPIFKLMETEKLTIEWIMCQDKLRIKEFEDFLELDKNESTA